MSRALTGDLVVIGSDAVNDFASQLIFEGLAEDYRYGTDDYALRSLSWKGRRVLVLAGGRGRSPFTAFTTFFSAGETAVTFGTGTNFRGDAGITGLMFKHPV